MATGSGPVDPSIGGAASQPFLDGASRSRSSSTVSTASGEHEVARVDLGKKPESLPKAQRSMYSTAAKVALVAGIIIGIALIATGVGAIAGVPLLAAIIVPIAASMIGVGGVSLLASSIALGVIQNRGSLNGQFFSKIEQESKTLNPLQKKLLSSLVSEAQGFQKFNLDEKSRIKFNEFMTKVSDSELPSKLKTILIGYVVCRSGLGKSRNYDWKKLEQDHFVSSSIPNYSRFNEANFEALFRGLGLVRGDSKSFVHFQIGNKLIVDSEILSSHESRDEQIHTKNLFMQTIKQIISQDPACKGNSPEQIEELATKLRVLLDPSLGVLFATDIFLGQPAVCPSAAEDPSDDVVKMLMRYLHEGSNVSDFASLTPPAFMQPGAKNIPSDARSVNCVVDIAKKTITWTVKGFATPTDTSDAKNPIFPDFGFHFDRKVVFSFADGFDEGQIKMLKCSTSIKGMTVEDHQKIIQSEQTVEMQRGVPFVKV